MTHDDPFGDSKSSTSNPHKLAEKLRLAHVKGPASHLDSRTPPEHQAISTRLMSTMYETGQTATFSADECRDIYRFVGAALAVSRRLALFHNAKDESIIAMMAAMDRLNLAPEER